MIDAEWQEVERCIFMVNHPRIKAQSGNPLEKIGEAGIRTLGTLLGYNALAKRRFRPLSHLTNNESAEYSARGRTSN
jgi:hypothetical protein